MEVFANTKDQEGPINQIHSFICRDSFIQVNGQVHVHICV